MKIKRLQLATLLVAFIVFVSCVVGMCVSVLPVSAATYKADALFTAGARASVSADANKNIGFSFSGNEHNTVSYNRNMAYKWYTKGEEGKEPKANYFSTEFSFVDAVDFTTFTVAFQSDENSKSDDEVTENQIIFFNDDGHYSVAFRTDDEKDADLSDLKKNVLVSLDSHDTVKISFSESEISGEYLVTVAVGGNTVTQPVDGVFTNIGGSYAKYSAAKLIPLSFSADVPEGKTQAVAFKSLNGQSFMLDENGRVKDDAAPVLVINDDIKSFILGTKLFGFSYEVIDVCDATVTKSVNYYQYNPEDTEISYAALTSSVKIFDKYTYATDKKEYVSIKFELSDDDENKEVYYVTWYAQDRANDVVSKSVGKEEVELLSVIRDTESPVYTCIKTEGNVQTLDEENEAYKRYVEAVAEAAKDLRAGEGYSFYLPSLADLFEDNDTTYSGLSFTIYYRTDASKSNSVSSNLSYDNLKISVVSTGGYQFKVVAADKQGNKMAFYQDGRLVTLDSDNVWEIDAIPAFTFYVDNKGLEVEEVKRLDNAYMYSNYTVENFTIKGLSGYKSDYQLYYLDGASNLSYETLIKFANYCYENGISDQAFAEELAKYAKEDNLKVSLRSIDAYNSNGPKSEDDEGWSTHDNRYNWRESSMSFTPQERGYYVVRVELVDKENWSEHVYAYQVVYAAGETDSIKGPSYWIENNIVTVVFAVIAVVAAIGAIIVWIAFPSQEKAGSSKQSKKSSDKRKNDKE